MLDAPRLGFVFLLNGLLYGTWVTRIPSVKAAAGFSDLELGLALLALGLGTFSGLPLAARRLARRPASVLAVHAAWATAAALVLVAGASGAGLVLLSAALALFGAALACMDVAMNAEAAALEQRAGRSIMSVLHGAWSAGALLAAVASAALAHWEVAPAAQFLGLALVVAMGARATPTRHSPRAPTPPSAGWVKPPKAVLGIGLVAAAGAVVEGGIAEWSGVFLVEHRHAPPALAAAGYAGFAFAMLLGRLRGDRLIDRWGHARVLRAGAALGAAALAAVLAAPSAGLALAALAVAGLGVSVVFPVAFSVAGRLGGAAPGASIAAVATLAYGSGLTGPPLIGFLADRIELPRALVLLVLLAAVIGMLAGQAGREPSSSVGRP